MAMRKREPFAGLTSFPSGAKNIFRVERRVPMDLPLPSYWEKRILDERSRSRETS